MPIGVVGYLSILQGVTCLYEFLCGKIQPGTQESDVSPSTEDDHVSEEAMNQSTTQSMRRHGEERCKAVAGGLSSLEGELGEESFQVSGTGLVNVTSGANSSSDPVEETGQTSTAGVTSKDQVTSESKDQPQRNSPPKEHSQTSEANASKTGGNKTKPNKAQSESAEDSVPVTPRKEQPKKVSSHEDQAPISEAGTSKEGIEKESIKPDTSDCSQECVPSTSSKEQPKGASTQKEQGPTCECIVGKEDSTRADPKVPTCDNKAIKTLSTASSNQQLETILAQKDQYTSNEDVAGKTGCNGRDQESSKEDQSPISVAVGGKTEGKDKESGKPSLSDHGENSFQVTSSKEQTRPVSEKEENKPSSYGLSADCKKTDYSVFASEEQEKKQPVEEDNITACEGKVLQNPFSDLVIKTVSTTSGKEQSQKKLALQDQREACAVVGNEKEPKRSSSDNAKENNPTTPGDKQARRELAPEHLDQIDEAGAGKKTSIENEPKPMGQGSDIDKKDASTWSSKKELAQNEESPLYKSGGGTKDYFLLDSKDIVKMKPSDESQECAKKTPSGERYSLMRHSRRKDNGKMELSDEIPESTKKAPSGKRYSLMRHPRNKTQPAAKPSEPESGVKDQIVEKLLEKMNSMERAEKKPEKGKQANTVAKAEEAASIPSQEEFPTINVEGPTAEVSKPNIVTVQALSESKTPESLDEKSQKEAKSVEPLNEISQNVLVRHISSKKMGLCVRQKFSTVLSTIVEETMTELANVATLDEEKVTGSLQTSRGQPNTNFPITQEADPKDSVGCGTKLSASSPAFVPRTATPILQPLDNTSSVNPQTAYMYDPATQAALVASSPVQQGTTDSTPTVQSRMQKSVPVRYQQGTPTTELPQMSTSSAAYNPYSAAPLMQQQPTISPAVSCDSTPVFYMYSEQLATHSLMAASPVQKGPTDNMPADQLRVEKSVPVRHQREVCTRELRQMTTSSAAYTTYSTALAMQQQGYIPLTANLGSTPVLYMYPEQLADYLSMAASPVQQGPTDNMPTDQSRMQKSVPVRHQQEEQHGSTIPAGSHQLETCVNGPPTLPSGNATYQSCDYHVPSIKTEMGYVSTPPSNVIATCTPSQQQVVEPHMHERFPIVSLGVPPTHNTQPTIGTPGLKQDMQWTPDMTPSLVVSKTRVPKESAVPSPNSIPNAAASHMKQHINIDYAVQVLQKKDQNGSTIPAGSHRLETCVNGPPTLPPGIATYQSCDYHVPSIKTEMGYVSTPPFNVIATCTPSQQQVVEPHMHKRFPIVSLGVPPTHNTQPTIGTPGLKQDMQRTPHMTSSQVVSKTRAPKELAVPSPNSIPNAAASHMKKHINTNCAVQVLQKRDQLTSSKVVPVTNAPEKTTSPTTCNTTKAAVPLKHQPSKTTLAVQEDVLKKGQDTFPKVVSNTNTPQEEAPSVSINATKALVRDNEQPNNTCHSQSQICSSQQAVRPKERGPLAKAQSCNTVETSAAGQTGSTAKSKLSRSTKRRRARGRQRERQRAAEAERREAEAEKEEEAAERAAAMTVKETEGADSSNQGLEASSSSNEIILNPDDLYYAVNWETEAARPLHNSALIVTACNTPKAAAPLKQQSQTTVAAVKEDGLKNDQMTSPKVVPVTNAPEKTASPTACNTPKAAAPLNQQPLQTTVVAVKEDVLKNDHLTSPKVVSVTNAPEKTASPTACNTPEAAAPLKHQQSQITVAAVKEDGLKNDQLTSQKVVPVTNAPEKTTSPTACNTPKAAAPLKHQQSQTTVAAVKEDGLKNDQLTSQKVVPVTNAPEKTTSPTACNTPKAAAPLKHQQSQITVAAVKEDGLKNDQLTSPKAVCVTSAPEKTASPTACNTPKAAAPPLKHQQSKTTLAVQEDVLKKGQVTFPKVVSSTNTPQEEAPSVSINATKAVVTDNEQPNNTCHSQPQICSSQQAVRPKERGPLAKAQSCNTVETSAAGQTGSTAKSKLSRSTKRRRARGRQRERQRAAEAERREAEAEEEEEAAEWAAAITVKETEGADSSNQGLEASSSSNEIILSPNDLYYAVNWETEAARPLHNSTLIVTACNTPKAAAPLKQQSQTTVAAVKEDGLKNDQLTSPKVVPVTNAPEKTTSPTACNTPKAAAPLKHQQSQTTVAAVKEDGLKNDQMTSPKAVPVTNAPEKTTSPTACNTPKAAAPLIHQQSQTTVAAVKEDGLKNDQMTSPKAVPVTNAPEKTTSPTACNTPKAAAPLIHQQSQITVAAVKEDGLKNDQLTSQKVVPVTNAPEKTTSPVACNTPKAAAPLKHQQSKTTLAVQEDVLKKGQVTFPKVVSNTNTPQEEAPSVSINATKAVVTDNEQPNNTCHSQPQICSSQQAVRPKERGPLAKAQSCNTVETSAAGQTGSTAKSKLNRSTKRRRARGRQRERQRAAEAERREAEAEKEEEAAEGAAAITVKETEGADSSNQGLEASSSSNEIILNPDDLYYAVNWETEAARPLHNSTAIFRPRVAIPEWAELSYAQVGTILAGYLYWYFSEFQTRKGITIFYYDLQSAIK